MAKEAQDLDEVFAAMANEHRRAVVLALALRPHSISELADRRGLSLPAIHKHVRVLEDAGMVLRRKSGRTNWLALRRVPLRELQEWTEQFNPGWGTDEETLENFAEHLDTHPTEEGPS
ncbi:MAG: winged helix-turn-helix transcriptional regulator [Acidimicrobiia bacterium]|nr:MAG: winged helix-turn-helix transcriptional regulator [Acidimicrobiia bacterium]